MSRVYTKQKQPSPFKLHLHRSMKHVPISYFGLMTVQEIAAYADPAYELMLAVRTKVFDDALPKLPDLDCWQNFYRDHRAITRGLRRNLESNFRYQALGEEDFGEALENEPAVYFYARAVLPALLLWQTTPQKLLLQVRSGSSEGKRSEAAERLIRLDPLAFHMPEVRAWCNVPNGQDRIIRQGMITA